MFVFLVLIGLCLADWVHDRTVQRALDEALEEQNSVDFDPTIQHYPLEPPSANGGGRRRRATVFDTSTLTIIEVSETEKKDPCAIWSVLLFSFSLTSF